MEVSVSAVTGISLPVLAGAITGFEGLEGCPVVLPVGPGLPEPKLGLLADVLEGPGADGSERFLGGGARGGGAGKVDI